MYIKYTLAFHRKTPLKCLGRERSMERKVPKKIWEVSIYTHLDNQFHHYSHVLKYFLVKPLTHATITSK